MDARFPTEAGRDVVLGFGTCVYTKYMYPSSSRQKTIDEAGITGFDL